MSPSGERTVHLLDYVRILKRQKSTIFVTAILCAGLTFLLNQVVSPRYQARSRLLVEEKLEDVNLTKNVLMPYQEEFFDTQREILESEPVFESSVKRLGLGTDTANPGILDVAMGRLKQVLGLQWELTGAQKARDAIEESIQRLRKQVTIHGLRGTNILEIVVEHKEPDMARDIANVLSREFMQRSLFLKNQDSRDAAEFLESQIHDIRQRLNAGQKELEDFQFTQEAISLDKRIEYLVEQQMVVAENEYEQSRLELEQERERVEVLNMQVKKERSRSSSGEKGTDKILSEQRILLELKLSELKRKYTEQHPRVMAIRRSLELLEDQQADEQEASRKGLQQSSNEFLQTLEREFSEAQRNYRVLSVKVSQLEKQIELYQSRLQEMLRKKAEFLVLQRELRADETLYETLLARAKQVGVEAGLNVGHIKQIEPATLPVRPVRPKRLLNLLLAVAGGLLGGIGLVFLKEYLDTTFHSAEDIADHLQDWILLGTFQDSQVFHKDSHLLPSIVATNPDCRLSESFRILRANLDLYLADGLKTFAVTSSLPGEGKSTTTSNLALSLVKSGRRVLLVDADFRKPKLAGQFGLKPQPVPLATEFEGLFIATADGGLDPAQTLSSGNFQSWLDGISSDFDVVLLDTAPLNIVADTSDLVRGGQCGVLLIVGARRCRPDDLRQSVTTLHNLQANVLGYVVSRLPEETLSREYQSYYQAYFRE